MSVKTASSNETIWLWQVQCDCCSLFIPVGLCDPQAGCWEPMAYCENCIAERCGKTVMDGDCHGGYQLLVDWDEESEFFKNWMAHQHERYG